MERRKKGYLSTRSNNNSGEGRRDTDKAKNKEDAKITQNTISNNLSPHIRTLQNEIDA